MSTVKVFKVCTTSSAQSIRANYNGAPLTFLSKRDAELIVTRNQVADLGRKLIFVFERSAI